MNNYILLSSLIASLLLHLLALLLLNWHKPIPKIIVPYHFDIILASPSLNIKVQQVQKPASHVKPETTSLKAQENKILPPPPLVVVASKTELVVPLKLEQVVTSTISKETSTENKNLDMSELLNQARKYDKNNVVSEIPTTDINGEYYGTYSGNDSGTFNIRLNSTTGVISGLLQSSNYNINLIISGNFSPDGVVQMLGKGSAGQAKFTGHINVKTRELSGSWSFPSIGAGVFEGRHE